MMTKFQTPSGFLSNQENLDLAIEFLLTLISSRLKLHLGKVEEIAIERPVFYEDDSPFSRFITEIDPDIDEFSILLLALIPNLVPGFLGNIIAEYLPEGGDLPEIGGMKGTNHRSILPTGETAIHSYPRNQLEAHGPGIIQV